MSQTTNANIDASQESENVACSVLVPVLNEERHIEQSVAAMLEQGFAGDLEFLLIDGGSVDDTRRILAELASRDPRIRVLENPRRGTPSGLNVGLAHARGRWVARMDAHTRYPSNYIAVGVQRLGRGDTSWVSGPQIPVGNRPVSRAVALAIATPLGRGGSRKWGQRPASGGQEYELDAGVFAGVWQRETLLACGGWDERWTRNQDSEMAGRFLARGEKLICVPAMGAAYTPRNSLRSLWRQYLGYGEYREMTAVRHPHTMRRSHLLAPGLVACGLASAVAPTRVRRLARRGIGIYVSVLAGAAVRALRDAEQPADAALVPVVLATMHFAHGSGALWAAARHGPPLAALAQVLGLRGLARSLAPAPQEVFAPSLLPAGGVPAR